MMMDRDEDEDANMKKIPVLSIYDQCEEKILYHNVSQRMLKKYVWMALPGNNTAMDHQGKSL